MQTYNLIEDTKIRQAIKEIVDEIEQLKKELKILKKAREDEK